MSSYYLSPETIKVVQDSVNKQNANKKPHWTSNAGNFVESIGNSGIVSQLGGLFGRGGNVEIINPPNQPTTGNNTMIIVIAIIVVVALIFLLKK